MPAAPRDRKGFQVAIFCASPLEAESVQNVFDICWEDRDKKYGKAAGDQNTYTTGLIGKYNVVLVHMPSEGNTSAALAAAGLRSSFLGVQLALAVGTCAVTPMDNATKKDIFLGDVIISTAMVQYDFGRQYPTGFLRKKGIEDSLGPANPETRSFMNMLRTSQGRNRLHRGLDQLMHSRDFRNKFPTAIHPGMAHDRLYEAVYVHQHRSTVTCDKCPTGLGTCSSSCEELRCEDDRLVTRGPRDRDVKRQEADGHHTPCIHLGRFGSANTELKSGLDRDRIATADELIAFEMEGAGIWEQYPTIVIKSASTYADSHTNRGWQPYAAATAAACMKVFLKRWIIADPSPHEDELSTPVLHTPSDPMPDFAGRSEELTRLKQSCFAADRSRVVAIVGLGGTGKSRLALEFANYVRSEHPQDLVYWVQAAGKLTYEKDVLEIGKTLGIPGIEDDGADVKALVKERLGNQRENKWFLILDNADDETLWGRQPNPKQQEVSLVHSLPMTTNGSIMITTRSRRIASFLAEKEVIELHPQSTDEAADMSMKRPETPHLAAEHPRTLVSTNNLASMYWNPDRLIQAEQFQLRALEAQAKVRGENGQKDNGEGSSRMPGAWAK